MTRRQSVATRCICGRVARRLTLLLLLAAAGLVHAQSPGRVGVLGAAEEPRFSALVRGLRLGLHDQGHTEQTVEIVEGAVARSDPAATRGAVETLLARRVQVLFVVGTTLARAAREVSTEVPIVLITPGDPVEAGIVDSLARPGRRTTGMTFEYPELSGKRLELLRELVPRARRILAVYDPEDVSPRQGAAAAQRAAATLGLVLVPKEVRTAADATRGWDSAGPVDGVLVVPGGATSAAYEAIVRVATDRRLPVIAHARTGGLRQALVTYGASDADVARQTARLVSRVLAGADPGTLPVERPVAVRLVLNLVVARRLGVTVPPTLVARADEIIE